MSLSEDFFSQQFINITSELNLKNYTSIYLFSSDSLNSKTLINEDNADFENVLYLTRTLIGSFGIIFNLINIIFFFFKFLKNNTGAAYEFIIYLNISSLINTISYLLNFNASPDIINNDSQCESPLGCIQSFFLVFSEMSQISTATILSLYILNFLKYHIDEIEYKERLYNITFGYFIPFLIALIGYFSKIYGKNGYWCWISEKYNWSFGLVLYIVIWVLMIVNIIIVIFSNIKIRRNQVFNSVACKQYKNYISYMNKISVFPLLLLVCWIFPTINRIIKIINELNNIVEDYKERDIFILLHTISNMSLGVFISITSFFFMDWENIYKKFKDFCRKKNLRSSKLTDENFLLRKSDLIN